MSSLLDRIIPSRRRKIEEQRRISTAISQNHIMKRRRICNRRTRRWARRPI